MRRFITGVFVAACALGACTKGPDANKVLNPEATADADLKLVQASLPPGCRAVSQTIVLANGDRHSEILAACKEKGVWKPQPREWVRAVLENSM